MFITPLCLTVLSVRQLYLIHISMVHRIATDDHNGQEREGWGVGVGV